MDLIFEKTPFGRKATLKLAQGEKLPKKVIRCLNDALLMYIITYGAFGENLSEEEQMRCWPAYERRIIERWRRD